MPCALTQAIRSNNPVIFFEHVLLYNLKGEVRDHDCLSRRSLPPQSQQRNGRTQPTHPESSTDG